MTKLVCLYGGPGSGKSTTAAGLFFMMKLRNMKCELVTEYAKELSYRGYLRSAEQRVITKEQIRRETTPYGKADFIITDSPVNLGLIYGNKYGNTLDSSTQYMIHSHMDYFSNDIIPIYLKRTKQFQPYGREQTEEEAKTIDKEIFSLMLDTYPSFYVVKGNAMAPSNILNSIIEGVI